MGMIDGRWSNWIDRHLVWVIGALGLVGVLITRLGPLDLADGLMYSSKLVSQGQVWRLMTAWLPSYSLVKLVLCLGPLWLLLDTLPTSRVNRTTLLIGGSSLALLLTHFMLVGGRMDYGWKSGPLPLLAVLVGYALIVFIRESLNNNRRWHFLLYLAILTTGFILQLNSIDLSTGDGLNLYLTVCSIVGATIGAIE